MKKVLIGVLICSLFLVIGFYAGYRYTILNEHIAVTGDTAIVSLFGQGDAYTLDPDDMPES